MKTFKSAGGVLHQLSDLDIANGGESLLPAGAVEVTAAEASLLLAPTAAQIAAGVRAAALGELMRLDAASIRSMREWIAAQPAAPKILKDREAAAVLERAKLV